MDAPAPKAAPKKQPKARPAPPKPKAGEDDLGVSTLPMSRVSKIIKADTEIYACSKEATFLIGIATEFFLKKFVDAAYLKARTDQRKTIQLKDMSNAVKTNHELMFLEDMIPAPIALDKALALRAEHEQAMAAPPLAATLDGADGPAERAPKPRGAADKAYTALERPGQTPFFLPTAAIVSTRKSKSGGGGGGGGAGGGAAAASTSTTAAAAADEGAPPPAKAPRTKRASSPRAPKDFSSFKKQERLPSTPNSLPTRARKSGPPAIPADGEVETADAPAPAPEPESADQPMEDLVEMA